MNVLIVYAHPEPKSLNGSLRNFAIERLEKNGHVVQVSDLYAMKWKAQVDADDALDHEPGARFDAILDSQRAFKNGRQSPDIEAEQQKMLWADAVILQFPLWWFSMPAILKGWVDRVYAYGFAYGVGEHSDKRWGNRYGEGAMSGKRAMVIVSTGGWESHYGSRGINGSMDEVLFPIQHGILFYPGFDVVPPMVIHRTSKTDAARYASLEQELGQRLDTLFETQPIAFRRQNAGDYEIPALTLRENLSPDRVGFALHVE